MWKTLDYPGKVKGLIRIMFIEVRVYFGLYHKEGLGLQNGQKGWRALSGIEESGGGFGIIAISFLSPRGTEERRGAALGAGDSGGSGSGGGSG